VLKGGEDLSEIDIWFWVVHGGSSHTFALSIFKLETSDAWISLNTSPNDMKFLSHIYSYMIYKITKLQTQKKLKQRRYDQKTRSALETSDAWISLNTSPNDMKFLSHIYSYMIYKITKLQTQKILNKGDMTKKPDLAQNFQKLLTLTKHIIFFWNFESRSIL